ncbi:MAG: vitamin K epoxide reductase family protein [Actinomycetota bacterium]
MSRRESYPVAPWVVSATFLLSLVGLGISMYLTIVHFDSGVPLACPSTGAINCSIVITGPYSSAFGIPFAVLGLLFFVAMAAMCTPWVWALPQLIVHQLRLLLSATGVGMIFYLVYIEVAIKHHICLWCTGVHLATFAIFSILVTNQVAVVEEISDPSSDVQ